MSKKKLITILGGTGFLGQNLAAALVAKGYRVRIPSRKRENFRELLVLPGIELLQANLHHKEILPSVIDGSDAVVNLVGILNQTRSPQQKFQSAHVDLTRHVLETCETLNIPHYIHMSALKADAKEGPSEYLKTKGKAENLIKRSSLNTTIFRPSVIFGVEDSFVNKFAGLLKLPNRLFFLPVPNARFAPVHVDDVVAAIVHSIEDRNTLNKSYDCCGPKIYSMRELIQLIATSLGLKRMIIGLNPWFSRLVARVLGIMPGKPFTMDNYRSLQVNSICEVNGLETLGIKPASMEQVIPAYLAPRDENANFSRYRREAGR